MERKQYLESLLLEKCNTCGGTGHRAEPPQAGPGPLHCNSYDGKGEVPNFRTYYPFSVENVREFEASCSGT